MAVSRLGDTGKRGSLVDLTIYLRRNFVRQSIEDSLGYTGPIRK